MTRRTAKDGAAPEAGRTARVRDLRLKAAAISARREGREPTARQLAAWRRCDARDLDKWVEKILFEPIPKRVYCRAAGRQVKVVNEQADRYGLPLRGEPIVADVVAAFHALIARLDLRRRGDGPAAASELARWRAELLRIRARRLAWQHERELEEWIDRREVAVGFGALFAHLDGAVRRIRQRCGRDAAAVVSEAVAAVREEIGRRFDLQTNHRAIG